MSIDIDHYPTIKKYLLQFGKERLEQLGQTFDNGVKSRKKTGHRWFELQDSCAYYEEFERESIFWPETMRIHKTGNPNFPRFSLKPVDTYLDKTCFMMNIPNRLLFLGVINSKVGWKIISMHVDKLDKGGYMMQKIMVEAIPIPKPESLTQKQAIKMNNLVKQIVRDKDNSCDTSSLESQVDELVYEIYNLTECEIEIIEIQPRTVPAEIIFVYHSTTLHLVVRGTHVLCHENYLLTHKLLFLTALTSRLLKL